MTDLCQKILTSQRQMVTAKNKFIIRTQCYSIIEYNNLLVKWHSKYREVGFMQKSYFESYVGTRKFKSCSSIKYNLIIVFHTLQLLKAFYRFLGKFDIDCAYAAVNAKAVCSCAVNRIVSHTFLPQVLPHRDLYQARSDSPHGFPKE